MPQVRAGMQRVIPKVTAYVLDRLGSIADARLNTTAPLYKQGLEQPDSIFVSETGFKVNVVGQPAEDLENGYDAFDIKRAMFASGKVKGKGDKKYVDVAFRHGADANATRLRGMPADIKQKMNNAVAREQRIARRGGRAPSASIRTRGRTPGVTRVQKLRFGAITQEVTSKTKQGRYDNMIRTLTQVGRRSMAQYHTIRRISLNSSPTSWWHPGFEGIHAIPLVSKDIANVAKAIFKDEMRKEGLDFK